jgi:hypothetical protein
MGLKRSINSSLARAIGETVRAARGLEHKLYTSYDQRQPGRLATRPRVDRSSTSSEHLRPIDARLGASFPNFAGLHPIGSSALGTALPGKSDIDVVATFRMSPPGLERVAAVLSGLGRCQVHRDECVSVAFASGQVVDVVVASTTDGSQLKMHRSDGRRITIDAVARDWDFLRHADHARVDVRAISQLVKSWSRQHGDLLVSAEVDRLVRYQAINAPAFKNDLFTALRETFDFLTTYGGNQAAMLMTGWEPSPWDPDTVGNPRFVRIQAAACEALADLDRVLAAANARDLADATQRWRRVFGEAERPPWV